MPQPTRDEMERLHAEITALVEQANAVFQRVGLSEEEAAWAKAASQQIAHDAISLFTSVRRARPTPKIRMLSLSAAVASALAIVDANARATDAFDNR